MRIHLNEGSATVLTAIDMAHRSGRVAEYVEVGPVTRFGSRSHGVAVELKLAIWQKPPGEKRRRPNTGQHGHDGADIWAATWAEWGWFLAYVFVFDPSAKAGPYNGADDFHAQTGGQFDVRESVR